MSFISTLCSVLIFLLTQPGSLRGRSPLSVNKSENVTGCARLSVDVNFVKGSDLEVYIYKFLVLQYRQPTPHLYM